MTQRPQDLPDFEAPPLAEVVLSVQFAELRQYRIVHAGLIWQTRFRQNYPLVSELEPLPPVFETFGPQPNRGLSFEIRATHGMPVPRLWFMSQDQTKLVQFQSDRFIHNWLKAGSDVHYPRYETVKNCFFEDLSAIRSFLQLEKIGEIVPNQCEVTYVNHIYGIDNDIRLSPEKAIRFWSPVTIGPSDMEACVPSLEDLRFTSRHIIGGDNGQPIGRLLITAQPGVDKEQRPIIRLDLTARGGPIGEDLDGVDLFFDKGRDVIVRAFTAITTSEMHKFWRRLK